MRTRSRAAYAVAVLAALASQASAQELLMNPSIEIATSPNGWLLEEFATNPSITGNVNSAQTVGFANQEEGGTLGLWLRAFQGAAIGNGGELTNAILSQTVPGTPGESYTMTGWSLFEGNYSGGIPVLDMLSPLGEVPSPTDTLFELAFLDSGDNVIGTPVELDLRNEQFNGFGWAQHTLQGTAPAGTANVRVTASAIDMAPNINPGQSAFFDTFSLTADSDSSTQLLTNANLELGADEPSPWVREIGADTNVARYEGFAARTGANGFWIAPRSANESPQDALFTQTLDAVPNGEYTLSGWSFFEPEYAGGVDTLNPESPYGPIPSDTETFFVIQFLDDNGEEIDTTMLDLRTVQMNDQTWREHSLSATAPANAAEVKIGIMAESIRDNRITNGAPFDDAYFDDFSLMLATDPAIPGDFDGDGDVDGADFGVFVAEFQQGDTGGAGAAAPFSDADFNESGFVDGADFGVFVDSFQNFPPTPAAVPEPTTMVLVAIGLAGIAARRRG